MSSVSYQHDPVLAPVVQLQAHEFPVVNGDFGRKLERRQERTGNLFEKRQKRRSSLWPSPNQSVSQMQAAIRPDCPKRRLSRRCEK